MTEQYKLLDAEESNVDALVARAKQAAEIMNAPQVAYEEFLAAIENHYQRRLELAKRRLARELNIEI